MNCLGCGSALEDSVLSCPECRRLVHGEKLQDLARWAKDAWRLGHFAEERALWAESLAMLPPDTIQHQTIAARIGGIDAMVGGAATPESHDGWKKASMGVGPALVLLLSKGKFLLLGLTKLSTLVTMFASLGVYWALYGWALAAGLVVSIYIHEMGHVAMIRRYGFPASAPMFIPGLGAFIQLRGIKLPPIPDSRIGLAGPMYGVGAAAAALGMYYLTGVKVWGVIAHFGAWVNLFNLIPVWQLDGSRGLRSFTRYQRVAVAVTAGTLWMLTTTPMLALVTIGCGYRLFTRDWQQEGDREGLVQYLGLLAALALVVVLTSGAAAHGAISGLR
jgi:Zn-dependent protease